MQMQYFQHFPFLSFTFHLSHPITTTFLNSLSITSLTTTLIPFAPFRLLRILMCRFFHDKRYTFKHFHSSHVPLTLHALLQSFSPRSVSSPLLLPRFQSFHYIWTLAILEVLVSHCKPYTFPNISNCSHAPFTLLTLLTSSPPLSISIPFLPLLGLV